MYTRQPMPFMRPSGPLARNLNNAWVPSIGWLATPNSIDPSNPWAVGGATASKVVGKYGVGAAKTSAGYTDLWTAGNVNLYNSAFGMFRYTGAGNSALWGNSAQNSAVYVSSTGKLSLYVSSGIRVTCNTTIAANDYFTVGYRNDATNGYEFYLNGIRDDSGGVSGWGNLGALTSVGTAGTSFNGTFECYGIFTWGRFLTPQEYYQLALDPWQMYQRHRIISFAAPAASNTMDAPLGTLTLTELIPTFTQGNSMTAVLGTMTLNGLVPTFTQGNAMTAVLGTATLNGLVPTFAQSSGNIMAADYGTMTLTGLTPTFSQPVVMNADIGTITLNGLVPTFQQGNSMSAPLGTLTLNGLVPTFAQTANYEMQATLGTITLNGLVPTFGQSNTMQATLGTIILAGLVPTFSQSGSGGVPVTFYRGVSKSPKEREGVSLPKHNLTPTGGSNYDVTTSPTVSGDDTDSPNYEGYDY